MHRRYEQLTPAQRTAVFHTEGPLLVLAGPGSGKTRVITFRIAALVDKGVRPGNICAITFTNKAADEMRQRALALGASAGAHISTFHSLCVRILRRYARLGPELPRYCCDTTAAIRPNFSIYDENDQARCIKRAVKDCGLDTKNFSPARMLEAISALKNKLMDCNSFAAEADDFFGKTLARVYKRYQQILAEANALDFDDLLLETAFLLERNDAVRSELNDFFRFLLVDEYQDTNHAQYRIAKALAAGHGNICVTGDPDQSIYRWRGADIGNILAFEKDWPDATVVKLEENFRSTPNILCIADNLIACNEYRKEKKLVATKPAGKDVVLNLYEDDREQAEAIARQIKRLKKSGASLRDIAVFYRINAMSRTLEETFIRRKIPYQVVRGVEFYRRKEIRDLLAYLRVLVNPDDEVALLRIINTPARGIGKTTIERLRSYAISRKVGLYDALKDAGRIESLGTAARAKVTVFVEMLESFRADVDSSKVAVLAEQVFVDSGLKQALETGDAADRDAVENVNELLAGAAMYDEQAQEPSLADYLQQIALFSDADAYDDSSDRVALMTLHTAKGLEFENVFVIGLEDGVLPHERSTEDQEDLEEERRLLFVGLTRAKTGLFLSYVRYRNFRGQLMRCIPSQFLYELGPDFEEKLDDCTGDRESFDPDDGEAPTMLRPGQAVRHRSFGVGTVTQFIDMGADSIAVVRFKSGQTKALMLKYAGLSAL